MQGPSSRHRDRIIIELIKKWGLKGNVIDIGCGYGNLLQKMKYLCLFKTISGLDIFKVAIEKAKEKVPDGRFFIADITNPFSLPRSLFDVAICSDILEHIKEDHLALFNVNRLLRPGGHIIVTVPYDMKNWTPHDDSVGHVRRYRKGEIKRKLIDAGFEVNQAFAWGYPIYGIYYRLILQNINPRKTWKLRPRPKSTISYLKYFLVMLLNHLLYYLFILDDLFTWTHKGRRLFAVATKTQLNLRISQGGKHVYEVSFNRNGSC